MNTQYNFENKAQRVFDPDRGVWMVQVPGQGWQPESGEIPSKQAKKAAPKSKPRKQAANLSGELAKRGAELRRLQAQAQEESLQAEILEKNRGRDAAAALRFFGRV